MAKSLKAINTRLNIINDEINKYEIKIQKLSDEKTDLEEQRENYEIRELLNEMKKSNISITDVKKALTSNDNDDLKAENNIIEIEKIS